MEPLAKQQCKDAPPTFRRAARLVPMKPGAFPLKTICDLPVEPLEKLSGNNNSVRKKPKKFPREVFTAGDAADPSPASNKFRRLVTLKAQIQGKQIPLAKASMTPVTSFKLVQKVKPEQVFTVPKEAVKKENVLISQSSRPKLANKFVKNPGENFNIPYLPVISSNKLPGDQSSNAGPTPRWKPSLGNTIKLFTLDDLPCKEAHARHNSNQIANLELASQYASFPRVAVTTQPKDQSNKVVNLPKIVRLKQSARNISSSQGADSSASIRMVKLKECAGSKTRPSSKEEQPSLIIPRPPLQAPPMKVLPLVTIHDSKNNSCSHRPMIKRTKVILTKNNGGLNLLSNKIEWEKPAANPNATGFDELCNVTFGESGFTIPKVQSRSIPSATIRRPNMKKISTKRISIQKTAESLKAIN